MKIEDLQFALKINLITMHMCQNKPQFSYLQQIVPNLEATYKSLTIQVKNTQNKKTNVKKTMQFNNEKANQISKTSQQQNQRKIANSFQINSNQLRLKQNTHDCKQSFKEFQKNNKKKYKEHNMKKNKRISLQLSIQGNHIVNRAQRIYKSSQKNVEQDLKIIINTVQKIKQQTEKQHPMQKYLSPPYIDYLG